MRHIIISRITLKVVLWVGLSIFAGAYQNASYANYFDSLIVKVDARTKLARESVLLKPFAVTSEKSRMAQKIAHDYTQGSLDSAGKKYLELYIRLYYDQMGREELNLAKLNSIWEVRKTKLAKDLAEKAQLSTSHLTRMIDDFVFYEAYIRKTEELLNKEGFAAAKIELPLVSEYGKVQPDQGKFPLGPIHAISIKVPHLENHPLPPPDELHGDYLTLTWIINTAYRILPSQQEWSIWHGDFLWPLKIQQKQYISPKFGAFFYRAGKALVLPGSILQDDSIYTIRNLATARHEMQHVLEYHDDIFFGSSAWQASLTQVQLSPPSKEELACFDQRTDPMGFYASEVVALQAGFAVGAPLLASSPEEGGVSPDLYWLWKQDPAVLEAQQARYRKDEKFLKARARRLKAGIQEMLAQTKQALTTENPARLRFFADALQAQLTPESPSCLLINYSDGADIKPEELISFWIKKISTWQQRLADEELEDQP